jgi:hypothetical protein
MSQTADLAAAFRAMRPVTGLMGGRPATERPEDHPRLDSGWLGAVDALAVGPVNWKNYYDRLRAFRSMEADRAGGQFPAPGAPAIALAQQFLDYLRIRGYPPAQVMLSGVGGVGFVFRRGSRKVYVEVNNKLAVHALFSDGVTEPVVQRVSPDDEGYQSWFERARAYLDE